MKSKKVQPVVTDEGGERVYRWKHETASEYPKKQDTDKIRAGGDGTGDVTTRILR